MKAELEKTLYRSYCSNATGVIVTPEFAKSNKLNYNRDAGTSFCAPVNVLRRRQLRERDSRSLLTTGSDANKFQLTAAGRCSVEAIAPATFFADKWQVTSDAVCNLHAAAHDLPLLVAHDLPLLVACA